MSNPYDSEVHAAQQRLDNGNLSNSMSHDQRVQAEAELDYARGKQQMYGQTPTYGSSPSYGSGSDYGTGTTSTHYSYSDGGNISARSVLVFFLSLVAIAAIAFACYGKIRESSEVGYPGPGEKMVLFDVYYWVPKAKRPPFDELKSIFLAQFKQKYGALFSSQMPWDELYKDCTPQKRTCLVDPYASVEKLRSFALKSSTLYEDMCTINAHTYRGTQIDFLVKPVWQVAFTQSGKAPASPYCTLANGESYIKAVKTKLVVLFWAYVALGLAASILSILLLKRLFRA